MDTRPLLILLIEDDKTACDEITECIDMMEELQLAGVTDNAADAIEYVKDSLPDAIILDLELHLGGGNGLSFLAELQQLQLSFHPYILITTNNSSNITHQAARNLGADFILLKHEADYSAQYVANFLYTIHSTIINNASLSKKESLSPSNINHKKVSRIHRELDLIGVSTKTLGYQYLTEAILIASEGQRHNIVPLIAQKFQKREGSVERAMQNAINRTWRTTDIDELFLYYTAKIRSDKGTPSLLEFICYYADKITIN